jgi:predicted nucleic acid-binding Zn ribbon protein
VKTAGEALTELLQKQFGASFLEKARACADFCSAWPALTDAVGIGEAGAHSRVNDIKKGILEIETDHPGWKQILLTKQRALLALVQQDFPALKVKGIVFWLKNDGSTSRPA